MCAPSQPRGLRRLQDPAKSWEKRRSPGVTVVRASHTGRPSRGTPSVTSGDVSAPHTRESSLALPRHVDSLPQDQSKQT